MKKLCSPTILVNEQFLIMKDADLQRLNGNQEFSAIKRGLKDYIVSKFNFEAEPVYF